MVELLVSLAIIALLLALSLSAILSSRENGRIAHCLSNLRQLGVALQAHHENKRHLPAAVIWAPAGEPLGGGIAPPGTIDRVSLGAASSADPDRVLGNWVISLLPFLEEQALFDTFDLKLPIDDARHARARATELPVMKCPSDVWNGADNHFQRGGLMVTDDGYARGNFAMNGGSNARCLMRLSSAWEPGSCPDGFQVDGTNLQVDTRQVWGSGIGGVNKSFRYRDFTNGLTKTVALDEIRAGVHAIDRRGVWALGFPGSSLTVAHGISERGAPNAGQDRIQGCSSLVAQVPDLRGIGMPCSASPMNPNSEFSEQATSRSMHANGVHVSMADGSAHFVANEVDLQVWHQMHKRDNQKPFAVPF